MDKDAVPDEWSLDRDENGEAVVDDVVFVENGSSLRITLREPGSLYAMQFLPKLKPGVQYLLTFFVKTEGVNPAPEGGGACVNIWSDQNHWFPGNYYRGDVPWTKQGFVFRAGPESNVALKSYIRVRLMTSSGSVWFDDVRLRELPAP